MEVHVEHAFYGYEPTWFEGDRVTKAHEVIVDARVDDVGDCSKLYEMQTKGGSFFSGLGPRKALKYLNKR